MTALAQVFDAWMRDVLGKLARKVEDLEDVKFLMDVLQKVLQRHSGLNNASKQCAQTHDCRAKDRKCCLPTAVSAR